MENAKKQATPKPSPQVDAVLLRMLNTQPQPFTPPAKAATEPKAKRRGKSG